MSSWRSTTRGPFTSDQDMLSELFIASRHRSRIERPSRPGRDRRKKTTATPRIKTGDERGMRVDGCVRLQDPVLSPRLAEELAPQQLPPHRVLLARLVVGLLQHL